MAEVLFLFTILTAYCYVNTCGLEKMNRYIWSRLIHHVLVANTIITGYANVVVK